MKPPAKPFPPRPRSKRPPPLPESKPETALEAGMRTLFPTLPILHQEALLAIAQALSERHRPKE